MHMVRHTLIKIYTLTLVSFVRYTTHKIIHLRALFTHKVENTQTMDHLLFAEVCRSFMTKSSIIYPFLLYSFIHIFSLLSHSFLCNKLKKTFFCLIMLCRKISFTPFGWQKKREKPQCLNLEVYNWLLMNNTTDWVLCVCQKQWGL